MTPCPFAMRFCGVCKPCGAPDLCIAAYSGGVEALEGAIFEMCGWDAPINRDLMVSGTMAIAAKLKEEIA